MSAADLAVTSCCLGSSDPLSTHVQNVADYSEDWASSNDMRINAVKTKEMVFSFCISLHLAPYHYWQQCNREGRPVQAPWGHAVFKSVLEYTYCLRLVSVQPAPVLVVTPEEI